MNLADLLRRVCVLLSLSGKVLVSSNCNSETPAIYTQYRQAGTLQLAKCCSSRFWIGPFRLTMRILTLFIFLVLPFPCRSFIRLYSVISISKYKYKCDCVEWSTKSPTLDNYNLKENKKSCVDGLFEQNLACVWHTEKKGCFAWRSLVKRHIYRYSQDNAHATTLYSGDLDIDLGNTSLASVASLLSRPIFISLSSLTRRCHLLFVYHSSSQSKSIDLEAALLALIAF